MFELTYKCIITIKYRISTLHFLALKKINKEEG